MAVLIGEDKASQIYVDNQIMAAEECGLKADIIQRTSDVTEEELLEVIDELRRDEKVWREGGREKWGMREGAREGGRVGRRV